MNKSLRSHLMDHLDTLKPMEVTESMDKCEAVEWAFLEGYKYRKFLDLGFMYGHTDSIKKVTSEVLPSKFPTTDPQDQDYNDHKMFDYEEFEKRAIALSKHENIVNKEKLKGREIGTMIFDEGTTNEVLVRGYGSCGHYVDREIEEAIKSPTCPTCLNNPETTQIFSMNEISMKLYDAKFRSIIDGDQLFKLLDYFEEKIKDEN